MPEPQDTLYEAFEQIWAGLGKASHVIHHAEEPDGTAKLLMHDLYAGTLAPMRALREYFGMEINKPE